MNRFWLIYSESKRTILCAPCSLFGGYGQSSFSNQKGFNDWKNAVCRIEGHEKRCDHKECVLNFKEGGSIFGKIDTDLNLQLGKEICY